MVNFGPFLDRVAACGSIVLLREEREPTRFFPHGCGLPVSRQRPIGFTPDHLHAVSVFNKFPGHLRLASPDGHDQPGGCVGGVACFGEDIIEFRRSGTANRHGEEEHHRGSNEQETAFRDHGVVET